MRLGCSLYISSLKYFCVNSGKTGLQNDLAGGFMKKKQGTKDAFFKAQNEKKKVLVTYFSGVSNLFLTKLCVPIHMQTIELTPSNKTDLFYFRDEEAEEDEQIFSLPLSEIKYLELSDESYNPDDYILPNVSKSK